MEAKSQKVQQEIDHIIECIHKNPSEELRNNVHSFARKVLNSGQGRPITDTLQDLKEKAISKVRDTYDQRTALQCQDTFQRFSNNGAILRKPEVVRMLLKLSEINSSNQEDLSSMFRQAKKRDLNHTVETNLTNFSESFPQIPPKRPGHMEDQLRIVRNRGSLQGEITQSDLVKQLSYAFSNTATTEIVETNDGYQLKNNLIVNEPVRKMVSQIADLGWLHKKISKYSERDGSVKKALRQAIYEELKEFYKWNSTMQGLIRSNKLSLRKLYIWSFYPEEILRWLAIILEAVEPFDGSHIISIVNSYRPSGLTAVDGLINRLLSYILQPLLNYIRKWIYQGELYDTRNEFFILENKKVYDSQEWNEKFKLIPENIPSILNSEAARMIYNSGKAINFLKNKRNIYNVKTPFFKAENVENIGFEGSNTLMSSAFMNWLTTVHKEVNKVLVETLLIEYNLKYHLQSMKNFFLCGKGDFIQQLYDSLEEKLSQKKQQISIDFLDGHIDDAKRKCFTDFQLPNTKKSFKNWIIDRLLAKKVEFSNAIEGWDCFNFEYSLQGIQPLQAILSPDVILNYQKIFNFLWKLKQVKQILKTLWISLSRQQAFKMRRTKSKELHAIFHYVYILRNSMSHFITNLYSYIMVMIESRWDIFWQEIDKTKNFDQIIKKHFEFQTQILEITLNSPRQKNIQVSLYNIMTVISNFKTVYNKLQSNFEEYYEKLRLYEDRQSMAQRGIMIEALEIPEFNLGKSFKDVREIKMCFDTTFKGLYNQIKKECELKVSNFNVLLAKLDFSEYFSNSFMQ